MRYDKPSLTFVDQSTSHPFHINNKKVILLYSLCAYLGIPLRGQGNLLN